MPRSVERARECDLYPPVKAFLQKLGYDVKGEVCGCDVVGLRSGEPPLVVELKLVFNLALVLQGVDRLSLTDRVYLAVARPRSRAAAGGVVYRRDVRKLCRRLGLGLMIVESGVLGGVEVLVDPSPYRPRKHARRVRQLLGEHARRQGDPNRGGVTKTPIITAYRQEALRCALLIERDGEGRPRSLRATGIAPNAGRILGRDVYGWFQRMKRGVYGLSDRARDDIARFGAAGLLPALERSGQREPPPARQRSGATTTSVG